MSCPIQMRPRGARGSSRCSSTQAFMSSQESAWEWLGAVRMISSKGTLAWAGRAPRHRATRAAHAARERASPRDIAHREGDGDGVAPDEEVDVEAAGEERDADDPRSGRIEHGCAHAAAAAGE